MRHIYIGLPLTDLPPCASPTGISAGWADVYDSTLSGQYFVVDNVPSGQYYIQLTVNPRYCEVGDTDCPSGCTQGQQGTEYEATTGKSYCHMLMESDYVNNVAWAGPITIP